MRKRNYKTIRGLMRQKYHGFLSVADVVSGEYYHKNGWCQPFALTDEALREFTDGICGALNMKDKDSIFDNIRFVRVKNSRLKQTNTSLRSPRTLQTPELNSEEVKCNLS